jgi:hypothetical protein
VEKCVQIGVGEDLRLATLVPALISQCLLVGRDEVSMPYEEVSLDELLAYTTKD